MQIIGRSAGRSAVSCAAYRAGERLLDNRSDKVHDYSNKLGVVHSEILAPSHAAAFLSDREQLWNHVETCERRKDAQLARDVTLALPHELPPDQRLALARNFVQEAFVSCGMIADLNIHAQQAHRGDDPRNHHAHVMLTLRHRHRPRLIAQQNPRMES